MKNDTKLPFHITVKLSRDKALQDILIYHTSETFDFDYDGGQVYLINNGDNSWSEIGDSLDQETVNMIGQQIEAHFSRISEEPLKGQHRNIGHTQVRSEDIDVVAGARQTDQIEKLKKNAKLHKAERPTSAYRKLSLMLLISFCIMYGVMFLNVDSSRHIMLSLTRLYMSILMVSPMAILMILMMPMMYTHKMVNNTVIVCSSAIFLLSLFLLRTQFPVGDRQYMKAMIPHHSSAIMTSKNAGIKDPRVRKLADSIIRSQQREIAKMKTLLDSL